MAITRGKGRGYINSGNLLKVHMTQERESMWIKVVAIKSNGKTAIGILENQPLDGRRYS